MSQNSMRTSRTAEEVDQKLQQIMKHIHQQCVLHGKQSDGSINYSLGANKAAFIKIADAMISQGIV
jgi:glutamate dehydrogenase (NADP+)